jgi:copper transport protein
VPILLLELRPALADVELKRRRVEQARRLVADRLEEVVQLALIASVVATVAGLTVQALRFADIRPDEGFVSALGDVVGTRFGTWYLIRLALLVVLTIVLVGRVREQALVGPADDERPASAAWWVLWGAVATGLLLTSSMSGHAGAASPAGLAVLNDVVHFAAGATWFTGILVHVLVLPRAWQERTLRQQLQVLAPTVARFSTIALASIALAAATGISNSLFHLDAAGDLGGTSYGQTLLVKLSLFVLVVGLGATNRFRLVPQLSSAFGRRRPAAPVQQGIGEMLVLELVLAIALLGVTGLLAGLNPAG